MLVVKGPPTNAENIGDRGSTLWVGKITWRRAWKPTPGFLPGKSYRWRNLADYSP